MKSHSPDLPLTHAVVAVAQQGLVNAPEGLARARAFAEPLLADAHLDTGENILAHADAMVAILRSIGGSEAIQEIGRAHV